MKKKTVPPQGATQASPDKKPQDSGTKSKLPPDGQSKSKTAPPQQKLVLVTNDYPEPAAISDQHPYIWDADLPAAELYPKFARRFVQTGDIFRRTGYAQGLLLASPCPDIPPTEITKASQLASIIIDRLRVLVVKDGKPKGSRIPPADLQAMLTTEVFLGEFPPVDRVVTRPMYIGDFVLTLPGYNDGGRGQRIIYVGQETLIRSSPEAITKFLDVMQFASNADRTNAVAAALTVLLRNFVSVR